MTDAPGHCSCSALRQAARHVTRLYDAALEPVGLGLNQYAILARLGRLGPRPLGELAGNLVMDRSTLGHLLRPLEARGLVAIRTDARDGRRRLIGLTAAGEALRTQAAPLWHAAETRFAAAFGVAEAHALRVVCKRVETVTLDAVAA